MAKPASIRPVSASPKVCMMIYSHPGRGKTRLIGTGGKGTLILRPPTDHTDSITTPGVDEWVVRDWDDINEAYEYLRHEPDTYEWVWLDSISLFQDHGLDDVFQAAVDRKPDRAKGPVDKGEYGINMTRLGRWIRHMVGQPGYNFGIVAHAFQDEDMTTDSGLILKPWIQGKNMPDKIMGYMNIVGYLEIKQDRRVLRVSATEEYTAKDQFDAFQKGRMADPTMPKIMAAIEQARAEGRGPQPRRATRSTTRRRSAKTTTTKTTTRRRRAAA